MAAMQEILEALRDFFCEKSLGVQDTCKCGRAAHREKTVAAKDC